jgi:hypothetical protein
MSHRFSFPLKALAVLTLVVLIDQGVGFVSRHIIQGLDDKLSQIGSIQQALMHKRSDVLILGASCAKYHYDSQILADSLQMTVENTGVGGMKAEYSDLVLQSYLERCTPRCVVIDVYGQLDSGEGRLPRVRPFYGVNEPVTSYYDNESDWQQRLKLQSALYRYNGTLDLLLRHALNEPNSSHGFAEMEGEMSMKDTVVVHRFQPDAAKVRHLRHVVQLCRHHAVRLVFVLSPRREHDADQEAWVSAFCQENNLQLINELHVPDYYTGERLFHDESHLNGRGAALFSQRVAHQLKNS